ncbi:MAG: hypothetical protein QNJ33_14415 [Crocosphaera sp.]|nr:hypothetical protein [Crocosphaera sp.]
MFNRDMKTATRTGSNYQKEWQISVVEILELDPWKYFKKPVLSYSKIRG